MKFLKLLACSAFAAFLITAAHAQSTVGTIYGSVVDPSGAKVSGADVVITDVKTQVKQASKTNEHGDYQFVAVNPSDYTVTITAPGFKTETQTGVTVDANTNVNVSFNLNTGSVNESVEVTAGTTLVDTRESQIGETIDQQRIEELPAINRDAYQLLQTVTGVTSFTADTLIGGRSGANFSVNGFPTNTTSFYLDGAQNNILRDGGGNKPPSVEALQEFRILTSNFDAEFGRSPGAVLNLITKSGTNAYHGDLYEFLQNNMFDAVNYFATPGLVSSLHQHQFGGTVGGPIPKLRQTFFFIDYAHVQLHTDDYIYASQAFLPSDQQHNSDRKRGSPQLYRHHVGYLPDQHRSSGGQRREVYTHPQPDHRNYHAAGECRQPRQPGADSHRLQRPPAPWHRRHALRFARIGFGSHCQQHQPDLRL